MFFSCFEYNITPEVVIEKIKNLTKQFFADILTNMFAKQREELNEF
jgi:hypothetical protein